MNRSLGELLQTIEVDEPQSAEEFHVFGLRWASPAGFRYMTLDEAMEAAALDITEVSAAGQVPTLKVINRSDQRVFLMAGEHVLGAKQDRVLNASYMVAPHSEMPVPVSCVEMGRWYARTASFTSGQSMTHGLLRKMMSRHAREGYRRGGMPSSRQQEVWAEVSRKLGALGSHSPSQALAQVYEDYQRRLNDLLARFHSREGQNGAAFVVSGRIAGVDLFDQPATLAKLWAKLIRAYALDAFEPAPAAPPVTSEAMSRWVRAAAGAQVEPFQSPGLGIDLRLSGAGFVGASLVVDDCPIHFELFPIDPPAVSGV
jgi:hypothetical protein